mgnify:CR=1 FL=1
MKTAAPMIGGMIWPPTDAEASTLTFYRAVGCDQCNHTGYRGRIGIYEVMHVSDKLRRLLAHLHRLLETGDELEAMYTSMQVCVCVCVCV